MNNSFCSSLGEIGQTQTNYFATIPDSLLTLSQLMTLDAWIDV